MSRNCGCSGVELPTASTLTEVEIKKLLEEVNALLKDTQAQILCQNGKIAETMTYIKDNLSLALQSLLDSMYTSGETTGNICATLNRINATFGNCDFSMCYTGIYAQSGCQVAVKNCTFDCGGYVIFGGNSYIGLDGYSITNGQFRQETGCLIQTVARGNSASVPDFNNSNYMRGYQYFATNLGYPLFYFNDGGEDHWRKADGTVVI